MHFLKRLLNKTSRNYTKIIGINTPTGNPGRGIKKDRISKLEDGPEEFHKAAQKEIKIYKTTIKIHRGWDCLIRVPEVENIRNSETVFTSFKSLPRCSHLSVIYLHCPIGNSELPSLPLLPLSPQHLQL